MRFAYLHPSRVVSWPVINVFDLPRALSGRVGFLTPPMCAVVMDVCACRFCFSRTAPFCCPPWCIRFCHQRAFMKDLLYSPTELEKYCGPGGRVILLCFMRSACIFVSRLLECLRVVRPDVLKRIVVVAFPFPDTVPRAGGVDDIETHFKATGTRETRDFFSRRRHLELYKYGAWVVSLQCLWCVSRCGWAGLVFVVCSPVWVGCWARSVCGVGDGRGWT